MKCDGLTLKSEALLGLWRFNPLSVRLMHLRYYVNAFKIPSFEFINRSCLNATLT